MQLLRGRTAAITGLAFSPGGSYLAATGKWCDVWDLRDAKPRPRGAAGPRSIATYLNSTPTFLSETVLVVKEPRTWWRFDVADGTGVELRPPPPYQWRVAVVGAGSVFKAAAAADGEFSIATWSVSAAGLGEPVSVSRVPLSPFLRGFAPAGDRYLSLDGRHPNPPDLNLRDAATDAIAASYEWPPWHPHYKDPPPCFAPDGGRFVLPCGSHLAAFESAGGPPTATDDMPIYGTLPALAMHPGGRLVATVEDDRHVTFRDLAMLEVVTRYDFAMPRVQAVAFSPDGTRCAVGNSRGKVLLFDVDE